MFGLTFVPGGTGGMPGLYTPTVTPGINMVSAVAASHFNYMRVGNIVSVAGPLVTQHYGGPGDGMVYISLPIASLFTVTGDLSGNATCPAQLPGSVIPDLTYFDAVLYQPDAGGLLRYWRLVFQYVIK